MLTELLPVVLLTVKVSGSALLLACLLGLPLGAFLGLEDFYGRRLIQLVISTAMGLPPVFVGLVAFLLLSRSGPLGTLDWLFTERAMILAQTVLAFPLVAGLSAATLRNISPDLILQIRSLGATRWQERLVLIQHARRGVLAAVLAAFGRIIAEVGAVILVGGNIAGKTRVLSTAIVLETRKGNFQIALALGLVLLGLALIGNALFLRLEKDNV